MYLEFGGEDLGSDGSRGTCAWVYIGHSLLGGSGGMPPQIMYLVLRHSETVLRS